MDMCSGHAPTLEKKTSFIGRWMDILRPGYERIADIKDDTERMRALEKEAVLISLQNLMSFPFIKEAVEAEQMTLHGLWTDIGEGGLEYFDGEKNAFFKI
jgi:carbonic anhydrase